MVSILKEIQAVRKPKVYTFEEYLRREEKSIEKHEFYNGKIIKMAGGTYIHSLIASNIVTAINIAINSLPQIYYVHGSDLKIRLEESNIGVYPDALVICKEHQFWENRIDVITNPLAIVEVLSPSTRSFDRQGKFDLYKQLPSFQEYILVDARKCAVETRFQEEPNLWRIRNETNIENAITLFSMGISISMANIYKNIVFPQIK